MVESCTSSNRANQRAGRKNEAAVDDGRASSPNRPGFEQPKVWNLAISEIADRLSNVAAGSDNLTSATRDRRDNEPQPRGYPAHRSAQIKNHDWDSNPTPTDCEGRKEVMVLKSTSNSTVATRDDPSAHFADSVKPHIAVLTAIAAREVGAAASDDLVQDTLFRAWEKWHRYRPELGSHRTWLIAILLDKCRRHRVRQHSRQDQLPEVQSNAGQPAYTGGDLDVAIASLPLRQKQVITLFYLADLPVADTARLLGISEGSVKSSLYDARLRLKSELRNSDGPDRS